MKMTQENYEFLLFELMEGNLDDTSAAEVLEQINANAFYTREWRLMQRSVLQVDDQTPVFRKKSSLYKPAGNRVLVLMPVLKYAAAAVLVLAAWGGIRWMISENDPIVSDDKTIKDTPVVVQEPIFEPEKERALSVPDSDNESAGNLLEAPATVSVHKTKPEIYGPEKEGPVQRMDEPFIAVEINNANRISVASSVAPVPEEIDPVNDIPDLPQTGFVNDNPGIRQWINGNLNELLAPYKNPRINISRADLEKSTFAFNITFQSAAFSSNTLVQLKR